MNGIGERIKGRRLSLGLGLREVARRAEVSAGYLSAIEHGDKNDPSLSICHRIAVTLATSVGELFELDGPRPDCPHGSAVWFNPHNGIVQCHRCGEVFVPRLAGKEV